MGRLDDHRALHRPYGDQETWTKTVSDSSVCGAVQVLSVQGTLTMAYTFVHTHYLHISYHDRYDQNTDVARIVDVARNIDVIMVVSKPKTIGMQIEQQVKFSQ